MALMESLNKLPRQMPERFLSPFRLVRIPFTLDQILHLFCHDARPGLANKSPRPCLRASHERSLAPVSHGMLSDGYFGSRASARHRAFEKASAEARSIWDVGVWFGEVGSVEIWECGSGSEDVQECGSAVRESEKCGIGETPSVGSIGFSFASQNTGRSNKRKTGYPEGMVMVAGRIAG